MLKIQVKEFKTFWGNGTPYQSFSYYVQTYLTRKNMASIFSKIIAGDLPSEKVYETETEFAFLDIAPLSEGHTLVVPKIEIANYEELPPHLVASLMNTVQVVARGVMKAMETPAYNLFLNNGATAGQVVFHIHFHIIPRFEGQPINFKDRKTYPEGRASEIAQAIRDAV